MTTQEMVRKLNNARRDFHGRKDSAGNWFRPPNPRARENVKRWAFRLFHKGAISEEQKLKIESEVTPLS